MSDIPTIPDDNQPELDMLAKREELQAQVDQMLRREESMEAERKRTETLNKVRTPGSRPHFEANCRALATVAMTHAQ